jgi:hypothetical protein
VRREDELVRAANEVLGSASSWAIAQGEPGVRKASFTNRLKTALVRHGALTRAPTGRFTRDLPAQEFEAQVLRALLHIRALLPRTNAPEGPPAPSSGVTMALIPGAPPRTG